MKYIFDKGEGNINNKSYLCKNFSIVPQKYSDCVIIQHLHIDEEDEMNSLLEIDIDKVMSELGVNEEDACKYTKAVVESVFRLARWDK